METKRPFNFSDMRFRFHLLLTTVGAIGIPAIFFPFAWSTSPIGAAVEKDLWRLAWPFFLPVLVTAANARWLFTGRISGAERIIEYLAGAAMFCITLSLYATMPGWPTDLRTWIGLSLPIGAGVIAAITILRVRRNKMQSPIAAIVPMQLAYLANCLLCLASFWGAWEIGAYCVLLTAVAYLIQIGFAWRFKEENGSNQSKISAVPLST
jgi:hypothetical protein